MSEEGYRNAYLTLSQELGDFTASSHLARIVYEATAAELRTTRRASRGRHPPLQCDKHFLVLANGRTGTTWLTTTLDQVPDVRCRKEIRWRSPQTGYHGVQAYIDQSSSSVASAIENAAYEPGARVTGSKLVVDPYWYTGPEIIEDLAVILEPEVRLIVLKRRYAETWTSWKVRGVFHRLRKDVISSGIRFDADFATAVDALPDPEPLSLGLCVGGTLLAGTTEGATAYSLAAAVDDMLVFFANDIAFLKLARASQFSKVVDYSRLNGEFQSLAEFIGASHAGIPPAPTEKLADVSAYISPRQPLEEFATALDEGFWMAASGREDPDELWSVQPNHRARIGVPGFWELVRKYGLRAEGEWPLMKPVARV